MQHSLRSHQNFFPLSFFLVVEKRWHNEVIRRKWWNYRFHICSIHVPSTKCSVWWKYVGKICSTTTHRKYHWSPLEDGHYIIYHQKNRSILENNIPSKESIHSGKYDTVNFCSELGIFLSIVRSECRFCPRLLPSSTYAHEVWHIG